MKIYHSLLLTAAMAVATVGCNNNDPNPQPGNENKTYVSAEQLSGLRIAPDLLTDNAPTPKNQTPPPAIGPSGQEEMSVIEALFENSPGVTISRVAKGIQNSVYNEAIVFNTAHEYYPSMFMLGNSIANGEFAGLTGYTLNTLSWSTSDLVSSDGSAFISMPIDNPELSDYNRVWTEWKSKETKPLTGSTIYQICQVEDSKDLKTNLGGGGNGASIAAQLTGNANWSSKKTKILVKMVQKAVSVSVDQKFRTGLLREANIKAMNGYMPVYVSSISYGKMAFALIATNEDYLSVMAALGLNIPAGNVNVDLKVDFQKILNNSDISYAFVGGKLDDHNKALAGGWEGVRNYLTSPVENSDLLPIAMNFRFAHTNGLARILRTGDQLVTESYFIPEASDVTITTSPILVEASEGIANNAKVEGAITISSKALNLNEVTIADFTKQTPIALNQGKANISTGNTDMLVARPQTMSMKNYMEQPINVKADLVINGEKATTSFVVPLKDFVFAARENTMVVTTNNTKGKAIKVYFKISDNLTRVTKVDDNTEPKMK